MIRPKLASPGPLMAITLGALLMALSGCGSSDDSVPAIEPEISPTVDLAETQRVANLVALIASDDADLLAGRSIQIEAWITPPPGSGTTPSTPPPGCPIVPEKQHWLTDEPVPTQFEVAGATLPNRLESGVQFLRLVVPFQLGFVDVPERGLIRGTVLAEDYAGCPRAESLFVLQEVVEPLPNEERLESGLVPEHWQEWAIDEAGIVVEYPAEWERESRETGGSIIQARLVGPEGFRPIQIRVEPGETFWHPAVNSSQQPPDALRGDRVVQARAGQARARLVDDAGRTVSGERELRLVFNHAGNTIMIWSIFRDGVDLDRDGLEIFSQIAERLRLRGDVVLSDPMDPVLAASDEIGDGPFLSEADAFYLAIGASGLVNPDPLAAELVSERDARMVTTGACRDFDGNPSAIWLVTVEGQLPTGQESLRLVYLDAETGTRLCQTEAPGAS